uniref:Uncharacterized protein n=1 Tax=Arundo donax TaxID=35708 RepID=A0A0A9A1V9_ARUDO
MNYFLKLWLIGVFRYLPDTVAMYHLPFKLSSCT